jgi:hypothetical protein
MSLNLLLMLHAALIPVCNSHRIRGVMDCCKRFALTHYDEFRCKLKYLQAALALFTFLEINWLYHMPPLHKLTVTRGRAVPFFDRDFDSLLGAFDNEDRTTHVRYSQVTRLQTRGELTFPCMWALCIWGVCLS